MAVAHQRLGIQARILHCCPECGKYKLHASKTEKNPTGIRKEYTCSHCGSVCEDWKPSPGVKF